MWMILDTIGHSSGLGWAAGVYCCKSPLNGKDQNKFSNSLTFARMSKRRQKSSRKYHQNRQQGLALYFFQTTLITRLSCLQTVSSEFMGKTFQAAQLTQERFLTIDHSCKIFF